MWTKYRLICSSYSVADWTSIEVVPALQNIVARAASRAFVGLPLCERVSVRLRVSTLGADINV